MKTKIKDPDFAAMALMLLALLSEVAAQIAADESLLAMLPPWLGPIVLLLAAGARYGLASNEDSDPPEVDDP